MDKTRDRALRAAPGVSQKWWTCRNGMDVLRLLRYLEHGWMTG